jgi:signal transduction histidine kinase
VDPQNPADETLKARLHRAESVLDALRTGQVDALVGEDSVYLIRLHEVEEEARRRNAVIAGINRVFQEALTCETERQIGLTCLDVAEALTESEGGFIGEIDRDGAMGNIVISRPGIDLCRMGDRRPHPRLGAFPLRGVYGSILEHGKSLLINRPAMYPGGLRLPEGHPPVQSLLGVPLVQGERVFGMLAVANRKGGYREVDRACLESLAPTVVQAYLKKRAEREIQKLLQEREAEIRSRTAQVLHQSEELRRKNLQLEKEITKRKDLSERLVTLLESDRNQISTALHDGLGQELVVAKMQLEELRGSLEGPDVEPRFEELYDRLVRSIRQAREISRELRPSELVHFGLVGALRALKDKTEKVEGPGIRFHTSNCSERLGPDIELALFRIAQESLINVLKHARAAFVSMDLIRVGETIQLTVEDDGAGFDPKDPGLIPHGISIMEERARLCSGEFHIESREGRGTVVVARVPLDETLPSRDRR